MYSIEELVELLRKNEEEQQGLRNVHAEFTRRLVEKAGGVERAAEILGVDVKTVRARERAAGLALVLYRGSNTRKVDADGRVYGETGQGEDSPEQLEADRKWFTISDSYEDLLRLVVYVSDGMIVRVREVQRDRRWEPRDEDAKVALPLSAPLTQEDLKEKYPALPFALGGPRPMVRGKIREYVSL
ncbi:hypothetical protein [Streptomyces sp. NPDC020667]|uniref:hypothetical protein n=1 Tax=Streptomyces sp. NPDC020667 TaxID=3154895 RepID=UPI0033D8E0A4